mgnify:CR=1 FL=1
MEKLKINGIDINLGYFISLFDKEKEAIFIEHLSNCKFDNYWLSARNGWINNVKIEYNQNFVLCIENEEIFISNLDLVGNGDKFYKFYKFKDNNTFKSLKPAIKKFIKLVTKG